MKRYLITLAALLTLFAFAAVVPAADDSKNVTIRFHGQSFFEIISTKGTRIVTDPHAIDAFGRKSVKADLVLCSHLHDDHTQLGVIENLAKDKVKVLNGLKKSGKTEEWNIIDEKFKDVRVQSVACYHDNESGLKRGKNSIFVIEMDGLRIVHLGDLGHTLNNEQLKKIGTVDVLLIPVGGIYTLNGSDAKDVVEQLKPRRLIIPMHFGFTESDPLLTVKEFLEDQKEGTVSKYTTNELTIDPTSKPPQNPRIAVLYYEKAKAEKDK
jgi:L-ascorbate metabolism protein UlaG (beta-lactamase superfamily)